MRELVLGDSLEALLDHRGKTPKKLGADFVERGVPVASAVLVREGRLHLDDARYVSESVYQRWMPEPTRVGDVLLTSEGPLGRVARVPDDRPLVLGQRLFALRGRPGVLDSGYLYYALQTGRLQNRLLAHSTGTTVHGIRQSALRQIAVPAPGYKEQQAVAEVLGALDDKIAANTRVAAAAEALFSARFAALIDNATPVPLSSFADFVNGKAFTKNASGTGRVVIRIAELNSGLGGSTVYNHIEVDEKHVAHPGDMLFAWSGSLTIHRWFRDEGIVNQHIFKVIPKSGFPSWLVWGLLERKIEEFRAIAADKATTMGHIQRRHLDEPVLAPTSESVSDADTSMSALWDASLAARQENERLAATRDALLPALMSGRLRVKDAEKVVSDAV